ncbi:Neuronal calcium sensor 1 [Diplonema papillatum]|nr:Neuronal calcium sensor 1 [Diplonema papillatum]KAJ9451148.1 Neuronal calcium sensor 1 [Diplonema papillatum]
MSNPTAHARKRAYSKAKPDVAHTHQDGLEYLLYCLAKEADSKGELSRDAFVSTVDATVTHSGEGHLPLEEQHAQLFEVFNAFDHAHTGKVKLGELSAGLHVIMEGSEEDKISFAFKGLDKNGDGKLSQAEFLDFFRHYFQAKSQVEGKSSLPEERWRVIADHLTRAFKASDTDKDGSVDIKEFMKAVKADPDHPFCLVLDSFAAITQPLRSPRRHSSCA